MTVLYFFLGLLAFGVLARYAKPENDQVEPNSDGLASHHEQGVFPNYPHVGPNIQIENSIYVDQM
jgi:hypothetical protein